MTHFFYLIAICFLFINVLSASLLVDKLYEDIDVNEHFDQLKRLLAPSARHSHDINKNLNKLEKYIFKKNGNEDHKKDIGKYCKKLKHSLDRCQKCTMTAESRLEADKLISFIEKSKSSSDNMLVAHRHDGHTNFEHDVTLKALQTHSLGQHHPECLNYIELWNSLNNNNIKALPKPERLVMIDSLYGDFINHLHAEIGSDLFKSQIENENGTQDFASKLYFEMIKTDLDEISQSVEKYLTDKQKL